MFQEFANPDNFDLETVLRQEVDCFNSVLAISEKVARQVDKLEIGVLSEMVDYRKEWIEKIQHLEQQRRQLDDGERSEEAEEQLRTISELAGKLVKIDDRIYKNLEKRKQEYAKKSAAIAGQAHYARKQAGGSDNPNKLNIIQE